MGKAILAGHLQSARQPLEGFEQVGELSGQVTAL